jgi:hypothetical protein
VGGREGGREGGRGEKRVFLIYAASCFWKQRELDPLRDRLCPEAPRGVAGKKDKRKWKRGDRGTFPPDKTPNEPPPNPQ